MVEPPAVNQGETITDTKGEQFQNTIEAFVKAHIDGQCKDKGGGIAIASRESFKDRVTVVLETKGSVQFTPKESGVVLPSEYEVLAKRHIVAVSKHRSSSIESTCSGFNKESVTICRWYKITVAQQPETLHFLF